MSKSKYDNMTADEIVGLVKPITSSEAVKIETVFEPYLFYRGFSDGSKECFCTRCKEHYVFSLSRTYSKEDLDFLYLKHNENGVCPKCHRNIIAKSIGKIKDGKALYDEKHVVLPQVISNKTVLLCCYYVTRNYRKYWYPQSDEDRFLRPCETQLSAVYLLREGKATKVRLENFGTGYEYWRIYKNHNEPFVAMFGGDTSYTFFGIEKLKKTFLKYVPYAEYENLVWCCTADPYSRMCTFLSYSAELPALEVLVKLGWAQPVLDVIAKGRLNKCYVNWQAVKPQEIFMMPKEEYKLFENYCMKSAEQQKDYSVVLKIHHSFKKHKIKGGMERACFWRGIVKYYYRWEETVLPLLTGNVNLTHIENYLRKQASKPCDIQSTFIEWSDYLNMAKQLKYDLTQDVVLFPKNLKKAHDTANETLDFLRKEKLRKEREELVKNAKSLCKKYEKKYAYYGEEYSIVLPKNVEDIIREGQLMHHCVGGYAQRHFEGMLCICFLRKNSDINTPYYTIEMRDKNLTQIQGEHNRHPISEDPKAEAFFNEWLTWVKNGSKKEKENKKKTAVTAA